MTRYFAHFALFSSTSAALHAARAVDLATISITAAPQYTIEAGCVQSCLYQPTPIEFFTQYEGYLPNYLGCTPTGYNGCYCTSAVQDEASSLISECVSLSCPATDQISAAISIYDDYCVSAGYPRKNANSEATTTENAAVQTTTIGGIPFTLPGSAATSEPSSSSSDTPLSSSGSKINIGLIVGAVLGGLALIAIILVIILFMMRQRRRARQEAPRPPPPFQPPPFQPPPMQQPPMQQPSVQITPVSQFSVPVSPMPGHVELDNKPMNTPVVRVQERANMNMSRVGNRLAPEVDANQWYNQQLQGDVQQLHGDSRPVNHHGVELPGNERY